MCLAVPGEILSIDPTDPQLRSGRVDFGGIVKTVSLACVPEATVGDYVLVHVGMAISTIDAQEAGRVSELLRELDQIDPPEATFGQRATLSSRVLLSLTPSAAGTSADRRVGWPVIAR